MQGVLTGLLYHFTINNPVFPPFLTNKSTLVCYLAPLLVAPWLVAHQHVNLHPRNRWQTNMK
jgi:hypothetical protein